MTNQQNVAVLDVKSRGLRSLLPPSSLPVAKSFSPTDLKLLLKKRFETEKGGAKTNTWVDSMRASSPTRSIKSGPSTDKSSWIIMAASKGKQIVMFLDYDGTLSPIVEDPDQAFMSGEMRAAVRDVARYFPTAIVTGRCRDKVYSFVKLSGLYYAGSHGMDIKGPSKSCKYNKGNQGVLFQPASEFLPMIDESWAALAEQVRSVLSQYPKLKLTQGRKVLEIRPTIKWDKGRALEFLLEALGYANSDDVLPIYIGDDRTDEDAFKVKEFLRRLVDWKKYSQGGAAAP
ncbi:hypothetical protein V6N13_129860 [Hibiscus sabdariffa]